MYFNARYYDPDLGQFISPDTLVPDSTNLFDYNRYMYARGNPMKYTDPTGHCTAQGTEGWDSDENKQCYTAAANIAGIGGLDYIQEHFGGYESVNQWLETAMSDSNLNLAFLKPHADPLHQQWCSGAGLSGQAGCGGSYVANPPSTTASPDARVLGAGIGGSILVFSAGGGFEVLIHKNGEIAVYGSKSLGVGLGAGGSARVYTTTLYDLVNARDYAGEAVALDGTVGPLVVGSIKAPNGMDGNYYGFAIGARISGSAVAQYAPPAYIIVNVANGTVSSPYLEEASALFSNLSK